MKSSLPSDHYINSRIECKVHEGCPYVGIVQSLGLSVDFSELGISSVGIFPFCLAEINECFNNPCRNGGTCIDLVNGFACRCPVEFAGSWCEKGERYNRSFASTV